MNHKPNPLSAGLPDTPVQTKEALLDVVIQERRVELFTKYGHRWFDLKRTNQAAIELSSAHPNWKNTDLLLPIPEAELEVNTHLQPQSEGY